MQSHNLNLEQSRAQQLDIETALKDKIEDLENWSKWNNLCFVGVLETLMGIYLISFLTSSHSKSIGHRIYHGPLSGEGNNRPQPAIVKYLNWSNKEKILQIWQQNTLKIRDIEIFQDFASVTQKSYLLIPMFRPGANRSMFITMFFVLLLYQSSCTFSLHPFLGQVLWCVDP